MINIAKPVIRDEEIEAVTEVLKSGMLAQGKKVEEFQDKFAKYTDSKHAIATSSGTTALHTAMLAAGIGPGDEVITTPFTFAATANSILYTGATPIFADIDPKTFNIDPAKIADKITDKTKAILPVHLYGQPADMTPIKDMANMNDLIVIEDAAQAHGAVYHGEKIGSIGDMGCFSFYPTKNMTTGEGGMVTTSNDELAEKSAMIRAHGESKRYEHEILGYNYRMTDIAAALGIVQSEHLAEFNDQRIANANALSEKLADVEEIETPYITEGVKHVFHQYTIRVKNGKRDELNQYLNKHNIGTGIHYPIVLYKQPYYQAQGITGDCPEAELATSEVLSLPVHPSLSDEDIITIADTVKNGIIEIYG